ncbi:hypothetical protein EBU71_10645 [bacterium]|nr:hypothetical protein [Candidatus Elulimicrobium humile]
MKVPLLKQSDGKESASFTMMIIAFAVVTLWLLVSIVEEAFGIHIREFSGAEAMSYLTPICALYYGRRLSTDKISSGTVENSPDSNE